MEKVQKRCRLGSVEAHIGMVEGLFDGKCVCVCVCVYIYIYIYKNKASAKNNKKIFI